RCPGFQFGSDFQACLFVVGPPCLSKIANVLGKPIQSDHMTSSLARLSYARVLVEIDLREDLQHSVAVSLPDGSPLHEQVVYEALPKFCNFCNVLGHNRILCPKAAASLAEGVQEQNPSLDSASSVDLLATAPKDTVLAPNPSKGWTTVEPRRKSPKRNRVNSKGKEVIEVVVEPHILNSALPACPTVISSLGAVTSVGEDVASGNITIPAPH
ncbi:hypothetical protein H0E87_031720, partial [Populus deltoides]